MSWILWGTSIGKLHSHLLPGLCTYTGLAVSFKQRHFFSATSVLKNWPCTFFHCYIFHLKCCDSVIGFQTAAAAGVWQLALISWIYSLWWHRTQLNNKSQFRKVPLIYLCYLSPILCHTSVFVPYDIIFKNYIKNYEKCPQCFFFLSSPKFHVNIFLTLPSVCTVCFLPCTLQQLNYCTWAYRNGHRHDRGWEQPKTAKSKKEIKTLSVWNKNLSM